MLSAPSMAGSTTTGPVRAVEIAEDPELGQHPGVPLRHLAADDRLDPRRVRLVLAAGEREHARAAVLDGDGRIEEGAHRVGHGEQVTRRETAERLGLGRADVALGEQRAQQRGQLGPGRAAAQAEERETGRLDRPGEVRGVTATGARTTSPTAPRRPSSRTSPARSAAGTPTPRTSAPGRVHGFVVGVVDDDPADVALVVRVTRDQLQHGVAEVVEDPPQARRAAAGSRNSG